MTSTRCLGLGHHITLNVDSLPEKQIITDYILCSDTNQTSFDLTSKETELIGTQTTRQSSLATI